MIATRLTPQRYRHMPWKNGLGVTTEIARRPADGDFDWRVSMATVAADGPFSSFSGYHRVLVVIAGAGLVLRHPERGTSATLGPLEPYSFSGDWATTCDLRHGEVRDFGVIARRAAFRPRVEVERLAGPRSWTPVGISLLYAVEGTTCVEAPPGRFECGSGETLLIEDANSPVRLVPGATGAVLILVSLEAA